jgi:uncharacterized protein (TIGR02145 family)
MQNNLNYGTMIDSTSDQLSPGEKYCNNDDNNNCSTYGGLYQWGEAVNFLYGASDSTSWNPVPVDFVKGVCPPGWHIPTMDEFNILATALDGWGIAGYYMKEIDTTHWINPNLADDSSRFIALGAGVLNGWIHSFGWFKNESFFWTSTDYGPNSETYSPALTHGTTALWPAYNNPKYDGFSVRCIRNY